MAKANTTVPNWDHLPAVQPSIKIDPQPSTSLASQAQINYWIAQLPEKREWELHCLQVRARTAALQLQHRCECEANLRRLNSAKHSHEVAEKSAQLHKVFKVKARLSSRSPKQNARKQRRLKRVG